jgi:signal transduction histidine kinase
LATIRDYLPRGNTLDDEAFKTRHVFLCWVLGLHLPPLFAFAVWQGYGLSHAAAEIVVPGTCLVFARLARNRRLAAFFVTAGLVFCSSVLVHLSGGMIEAHFHFFILIGLIALYQDWVPFVWNVAFTVLSHGLGTVIASDLMFNHSEGQNRPWSWAVIHGVSVLAACVGEIVFWRYTELEQERNTRLAADLATVQSVVEQRRSVSELFVNLARRNQSLLDRQLELIGDLEQRERSPDALSDLFQLDHLATRIRRNAESLLVLSGDDPPRRWGRPVPLSEVVRAAAAEVEDFRRVEVLVSEHLEVSGRAVADLSHLLAELIENATTFSPPTSEVRVRSHLAAGLGGSHVLSIEDTGIGMPADDLVAANELLAEPPEVDLRRSSMLGFHVVGRLAERYRIDVRLAATPGGGLTALVTMPDDLVSERRVQVPAAAGLTPGVSPGLPAGVTAGGPPAPDDHGGPGSMDGWQGSVADHGTLRPSQIMGSQLTQHTPAGIALGGRRVDGRASRPSGGPATAYDDQGGPGDTHAHGGVPGGVLNGWHRDPPSGPVALPASLLDGGGTGAAPPPIDLPPGPGGDGRGGHGAPGSAGHPDGSERSAGGDGPPLDGLARRVPGAGLAPSLRRRPGHPGRGHGHPGPTHPAQPGYPGHPGPGQVPGPDEGQAPGPAAADPAVPSQPARGDRERMRSMLSRFQENQRAGRAAASAPETPPEERP